MNDTSADWTDKLAQAVGFHRAGRFDAALPLYRSVLDVVPNHAEALALLATLHTQAGRFAEALPYFDAFLEAKPDSPVILMNRGVALHELGRLEEALASYDGALRVQQDYAEAWFNRGRVLKALEHNDDALASYDHAIAIRPNFAAALNNRGNLLQDAERHEEALASFDAAIAASPDFAELHSNRANVLGRLNRHAEAVASYDRAMALNPDDAATRWNAAFSHLSLGDFAAGWKLFEWRWKVKSSGSSPQHFAAPLWLGQEDLRGKTILLHAEQGIGDTIQFCRYAGMVSSLGAKVILGVPSTLRALMTNLAGVAQVISGGESFTRIDYHCPLLSLPLAFATDRGSIPAPIPYLTPDPARVARLAEKLGPRRKLRVGLAWTGSPGYRNDRNRSIAMTKLLPLAQCGAELFSLQRELTAAEYAILAEDPTIKDVPMDFSDFSDTAAFISLMDLVISVDTSIAHAAGALGKPVWVLLPFAADWRWMLDHDRSPWYPQARLFRQKSPIDWAGVVAEVGDELKALAGSPPF